MVAADASEQLAWVAGHGVTTDDIALDFEHAFRMAESLAEEGSLDPAVVLDLGAIDLIFCGMSGRDRTGRWAEDALATDPGWVRVRALARQVLVVLLGEWHRPLPEICVVR
ncbi:hypothetical protein [Streptacidiphilus griseoplanus]|uniref:hypothetical protein n=1 Tax=Peterkaempfera griseoplana TaxID=66896 RepID=UPI000AF65E31|nr:hypothetical protein [Peterkaempfera griseoplana]